jgi:hypothetical protein
MALSTVRPVRWMPRIAAVVVALLVVTGIGLTVSARPPLDDARSTAQARWRDLSRALDARYNRLGALESAVAAAGDRDRPVVAGLERTLRRWRDVRGQGAAVAVPVANDLEGLGRRLLAVIESSDRLQGNGDVASARDAFTRVAVPDAALRYDAAVADYEAERRGTVRRIVAALLGFDALPAFDAGAPAASPSG